MEFDDWDLSAEELDSLERDALKQISLRNSSYFDATTSTPTSTTCSSSTIPSHQQPSHESTTHSSRRQLLIPPANPITHCPPYNKVDTSLSPSKRLPASTAPNVTDDCSKQQPIRSVKFFLHASGNIAAKFSYDQVLVGAFRKIPKAGWNAKERLWIFPFSSFLSAEKVLSESPGSNIEVEHLDPLVQRAIAAASAVPDLQGSVLLSVTCPVSSVWVLVPPREAMVRITETILRDKIFFLRCYEGDLDNAPSQGINSLVFDMWPYWIDRYDRIPGNIESKLMPFQRDGVKFILQHGSRVLLADEMGLGKTLQAIAVTSCIRESWPVLVLTPSSLRLHWASMIQQWLDIPSSDIL
ncbi:unnamed protein product, partial [Ilex paraguariensis]